MRLKTQLLSVITVLSLIISGFSGVNLKNSIVKKQQLEFTQKSSKAISLLLTAGGNWAVERGVTNASSNAGKSISKARKAIINTRREAADTAFLKAFDEIKKLNIIAHRDLLNKTLKAYNDVLAFRKQIDHALEQSISERNQALTSKIVPTLSNLIMTSQDLRYELVKTTASLSPELGRQAEIKHFSWMMSEYAGRERAIIGGIIAKGGLMPQNKLLKLTNFRSKVETGNDLTNKLITESDDTVKQAAKTVQSVFFKQYQTLRQQIYQSGMVHGLYPVSVNEWIKQATKAINTILALQQASVQETNIYLKNELANVTLNFWIGVASVLISLIASISGIYIVLRKVCKPLKNITNIMKSLSQNNTDVNVPNLDRKDEIGEIATSVQIFKENAIERNILELEKEHQQEQEHLAEQERKEREIFFQQEQERKLQEQEDHIASEIKQIITACTSGDFTQRMEEHNRHGLLLTLSQSMNKICSITQEGLLDARTALENLKSGYMSYAMKNTHQGLFKEIANAYADMRNVLKDTVLTINCASDEVQLTATNVLHSTTEFSQRTEEQAATLEETAAAMEEATGVSKHNMESAQSAENASKISLETAHNGGVIVMQATDAMDKIQKSSNEIANIILVIDQISAQTNLLALNAAVEAARAGDAGKGFAVVATEVRSLAKRCSEASEEIKHLIRDTVLQLENGTKLVKNSGTSMNDIISTVTQTSDYVKNITQSAKDQMVTLDEINKAVRNLDRMTQTNATLADDNLAIVRSMSQQGDNLVNAMTFFKEGALPENIINAYELNQKHKAS
ncbi:MAG: methyl-accepting chemotaxis protein [Alphaproteobacteria bacterium]|jgi:methyl-accepting chemotaxis protein